MSKKKDKKDKPVKLSKEEQARAAAEAVNDIDNEEYKIEVANECRALIKLIRGEDQLAIMF